VYLIPKFGVGGLAAMRFVAVYNLKDLACSTTSGSCTHLTPGMPSPKLCVLLTPLYIRTGSQ
jgi:hypothetical protein